MEGVHESKEERVHMESVHEGKEECVHDEGIMYTGSGKVYTRGREGCRTVEKREKEERVHEGSRKRVKPDTKTRVCRGGGRKGEIFLSR